MSRMRQPRLLQERAIGGLGMPISTAAGARRPAKSVTVNLAESPLGWLLSRGLVSRLQFDAGERLRMDWERSQLAPSVTMAWDAAPIARGRGGASPGPEPSSGQLDARRRFHAAVASAGRPVRTFVARGLRGKVARGGDRSRLAGTSPELSSDLASDVSRLLRMG